MATAGGVKTANLRGTGAGPSPVFLASRRESKYARNFSVIVMEIPHICSVREILIYRGLAPA